MEESKAIADARWRLGRVLNEMKLLANNIEVDPKTFLRQDKVVNLLRKTVDVLVSFDDILEHAKAEEGGDDVETDDGGDRATGEWGDYAA